LTFWFTAILLFGFIIFGELLLFSVTSTLDTGRDQKLKERAERRIEALQGAHWNPQGLTQHGDDFILPSPDGRVLQAYNLDGKNLTRSQVAEAQFPWPAVPTRRADLGLSTTFKGQTYRVFVLTKSVHGVPLRMFAARVLTDNPSLLDRPVTILIRFIPAMLLVAALAGYFISRRALMPVARLTESARSITIGNLATRLPVSPVGDELSRLAETCNEMLSRLEEAVKRITQFTADASHELRSPIAFIMIASEDTLRIPGLPKEAIQNLRSIVSETVHAQQLLEDMLLLARFDAGPAPITTEPIFLVEITESVVSRSRVLAAQKKQHIVSRLCDEDLITAGDAQMFRRLVWILLENAIKYTPPGSTIEVGLTRDDTRARLTVSDNGPGISEVHLPHIFDRFFRVDPSRGEQDGTGLGLAIAKWIAEAHRAEITARSKTNYGTTFEVLFPLIDLPTLTTCLSIDTRGLPTPAQLSAHCENHLNPGSS
jgi:heavy metal sensor kinase